MKVIIALALLSAWAGAFASGAPPGDGKADTLIEIKRKAEGGDAKAQFAYAEQFIGMHKYAAAEHWYRAAGVQGDTAALYALAELYRSNHGSGTNVVKANTNNVITLHKLAAALGHTKSHFELGMAYKDGVGIRKDLVRAYAHIKLSDSPQKETRINQLVTEMAQEQITAAEKMVTWFKPKVFQDAFAELVFDSVKITGIFGSDDGRMAMINGKPLDAGQKLNLNVGGLEAQVKLASISRDGVLVSYGKLERKITPQRL
ncbi:MAG TPA: hypothetical protein VM680_17605 [Verrucomicrobiae bacterium]|nr:hypothetical protein [Verrucomicrobiae bacterium]